MLTETRPPRPASGPLAVSAYLEAALDCVVVADAAGRVVEFNRAAERTFGYSREEAIGRELAELIVPPALRQRHSEAFGHFAATGEGRLLGQRLELTGMRADGSEFPVELALSRVEGEPLRVCGVIRDVTHARRAEHDLRRHAAEHAALRRVATLIAREQGPAEVFATVAEEVGLTLDVPLTAVIRFEMDGTATQVGAWGEENPFPVGTSWPLDEHSVSGQVARTRMPARVDDYSAISGEIASRLARETGIRTAVGVPILVQGGLWGAMMALSTAGRPLGEQIEQRLAAFTELIATAIANTQARDDLRRLADEQAALRRVATLVAERATPYEVFAVVAEEVARLLDVPAISMVRFERDETSTAIAVWGDKNPFGVGAKFEPWPGVMLQVRQTGRPARLEDFAYSTGPTTGRLLAARIHSGVGVPITVEGGVWGTIIALATGGDSLPAGIAERLSSFTDLVATAIANAEARDELDVFVREQEALRRVATQVAEGAGSPAVYDAICRETGQVVGATSVNLCHFTADRFNLTMAGWSLHDTHVPTGTRLPIEGGTINELVYESGAPVRVESYADAQGALADMIRERGIKSEVAAPVIVDGRLWGSIIAGWDSDGAAPAGAEHRLAGFAELVATAVSNALARSELVSSRARLVTAADEARRNIERNLHDGIQQQLVALALELKTVEAEIPTSLNRVRQDLARLQGDLETVLDDVREISQGVHPATLSQWGLGPALRTLIRRSPIPVELQMSELDRLPESVETAAYYAVSEALANVAKHAQASYVSVEVTADGDWLQARIRDDGIGGADAGRGSGLTGLVDRVEALGGRLSLTSPAGEGTTVSVELPIAAVPGL